MLKLCYLVLITPEDCVPETREVSSNLGLQKEDLPIPQEGLFMAREQRPVDHGSVRNSCGPCPFDTLALYHKVLPRQSLLWKAQNRTGLIPGPEFMRQAKQLNALPGSLS